MADRAGFREKLGMASPRPTPAVICSVLAVLPIAAGMGVAGGNAGIAVGVIGAVLFGTALILAPVVILGGRGIQKKIAALLDGGALAHWHYTADDLHAWTSSERTYVKRQYRGVVIAGFLFLTLGVVIGALAGGGLGALIGVGSALLLSAFVLIGTVRGARVRDLPRVDRAVPEVFVGLDGLYQPGPKPSFAPLSGFGLTLRRVATEQDELLVIVFTEERQQTDSRGFQSTVTTRVRVAVPKGQEAEANTVVAKFSV